MTTRRDTESREEATRVTRQRQHHSSLLGAQASSARRALSSTTAVAIRRYGYVVLQRDGAPEHSHEQASRGVQQQEDAEKKEQFGRGVPARQAHTTRRPRPHRSVALAGKAPGGLPPDTQGHWP